MSHFGIYLGFDPQPKTGYVLTNFGLDDLNNRLGLPINPPNKRMTASNGGDGGLVVWAASNCNTVSSRLEYLQKLNEVAPVHSLGNCWRTHTPDSNFENQSLERIHMGKTYKFWYAAENYLCDGYVTEKFWYPYAFGSVPILYGTGVHAMFAPSDDSYLDVRNFTSPAELGRFLLRLDQYDEFYLRYHAWRTRPKSEWNPNFVTLLNRLQYGRSSGSNDPYAYVFEEEDERIYRRWQCSVAAEILRQKGSRVKNKLDAVPKCSDPSGKTIPV